MARDASAALSVRQTVQNFLNAARTGNLDLFKKLAKVLDEGNGVAATVADVKDANNRSALHFAAREGRTEVCQYLLEELKLDVDVKDDDGETPLIHASRQGHYLTAKYLLEQGADPSASSDLGATALHHAAGIGNLELMKLLLSKGVDIESQSDAGTPLIWAAGHGQPDAVKFLLEHHAKANAETDDNITPLLSVVAAESLPCLELLLENQMDEIPHSDDVDNLEDLEEQEEDDHQTKVKGKRPISDSSNHPTVQAQASGVGESAYGFRSRNASSSKGASLSASAKRKLSSAQTSLVNEEEINLDDETEEEDTDGYKSSDGADDAGADPNVSAGGATPLHVAADNGNQQIINCLIKAGGNPNLCDEDGLKPIQIAALRGNRDAIEVLLPLTSSIPKISNWSIDGVIEFMQSDASSQQIRKEEIDSTQGATLQKPDIVEVTPEAKKRSLEAKSRGDDAFRKKDYLLAVDAYTQAIDLDPNEATLLSNRSLCWIRLGQGEQALADAKACRALKPEWPKAYYREGAALRLLQRFDEAASVFYEAVELDPENKELVEAFREAVEAGRQFHGTNQKD
ncbi:hypothetical protein ZIOFF_025061 [Zingiber officinale]|uniref:Serine/threonine-protein kinase BSK1-like TPR repeats domain-containing protein n=1 Tax=Zingiber officinale TaxID=94328 RepID=A0A8J5H132_ZINOF|nr:hypothetical protein ZIOFF_025061 [Zingiber officinale]